MRSEPGAAPVAVRAGAAADAAACAAILNAWIDATAWMPRRHAPAEVARHLRDVVVPSERVLVAAGPDGVAGYLALAGDGTVSALYVAAGWRGRGVGLALLDAAKRARPAGLRLRTFAANAGARRFYARHGFREVGAGGDNEEGLPDLLLAWDGGGDGG
jgi:GNAT superfamily N-acetyltransferase